MNILKWISKYLVIVILWIVLAFFVARIEYDSSDLSASVLSLTEKDFFEAKQWDVWYKKENEIFEIFLSEKNRNNWPLNVSILYSPDKIELYTNNIKTNYKLEILKQEEWNTILNVDEYQFWDFNEWLFQLPYSWDIKDITLEYVTSSDINYSIWNLDNIENLSH